jgi:dTDP-4-amino-4,6-dideoxygalactose transaminase
MVVTNDEDLAWEYRSFRDHGYDVRERMNMLALEEKLPYIHNRVGFNFRLTEIQSIIGLNELKRLDSWNLRKRYQFAGMYDKAFQNIKGIKHLPLNTAERKNAYWWYPIILDLEVLNIDAQGLINELHDQNIPCYGIQWPEAYKERAYREHNGFGAHKFPFRSEEYTDKNSVKYQETFCTVANSLRSKTICLFLHPSWEVIHIERCINAFISALINHQK